MKLALFADIHSNLEAITACIAHAQALGADRYAFLGDLVGYGADPVAVLDLIERYAADGAVVVLGNHDAAALGRTIDPLNANAEAAIAWTRTQSWRQAALLSREPSSHRQGRQYSVRACERGRAGAVDLHHRTGRGRTKHAGGKCRLHLLRPCARAEALLHGRQRTSPCRSGPSPEPRSRSERIANGWPSSARPASRGTAATRRVMRWLDLERARLTFFRVAYDHDSATRKIRSAGLPERLARRLERGA